MIQSFPGKLAFDNFPMMVHTFDFHLIAQIESG